VKEIEDIRNGGLAARVSARFGRRWPELQKAAAGKLQGRAREEGEGASAKEIRE
jgi:hypothetical protein